MDPIDLTTLLVAGHGPEHISGMDPRLRQALTALYMAAPPEIQAQLRIQSGYRSVERQQQLWDAALAKYGSPAAARHWVAPPGGSQHNRGTAADLSFGSDAARDWVHQNAASQQLAFPMSWEPWHIELAGARGGGGGVGPTRSAAAGMDPTNPLNQTASAPVPSPTPAGQPPPQSPLAAAFRDFASSMQPPAGPGNGPALSTSSGPFAAGMAADQSRVSIDQLKDFLMPVAEEMSTSPAPLAIPGEGPPVFGQPKAQPPGIFGQFRARPAPLGPGMRLRA